jgi:hypothetical protein
MDFCNKKVNKKKIVKAKVRIDNSSSALTIIISPITHTHTPKKKDLNDKRLKRYSQTYLLPSAKSPFFLIIPPSKDRAP